MCYQRNSKALAPPSTSVRRVSSQRRACRTAVIAESTLRYKSRREPRTDLPLRIREIAQVRVLYGYRKILVLLKRESWNVGKKLIYRLYCEEGLTLRHKPRRRRCATRNRRERVKPTAPNEVWSLNFVADPLADGRTFRALTVVNVFTRGSLAIEVGQSLKGEDAVRVLSRIGSQRAVPKTLVCDNGQVNSLHRQATKHLVDSSESQTRVNEWRSKKHSATCRVLVHFPSSFASKALGISRLVSWFHEKYSKNPDVGTNVQVA